MKHKTHRRALTSDFPCRPSLIALAAHVEFAVAATRPVVAARQNVAQGAGEAVTGHAHAPAATPASRAINCNRADAVPSKACKSCGDVKPLSEFSLRRRDGYDNHCKACTKAAAATRAQVAARKRNVIQRSDEVQPRARTGADTSSLTTRECECCGDVKPLTEYRASLDSDSAYAKECRECEETEAAKLRARAFNPSTATARLVTFDTLTDDARRLKGDPAVYQHGRSKITAVFDKKTDTTHYAVSGWPCPAADLQFIFRLIESGQPVRGLP